MEWGEGQFPARTHTTVPQTTTPLIRGVFASVGEAGPVSVSPYGDPASSSGPPNAASHEAVLRGRTRWVLRTHRIHQSKTPRQGRSSLAERVGFEPTVR